MYIVDPTYQNTFELCLC